MVVWFFFIVLEAISVLADDDSILPRIFYGQDARIEDYPFFAGLDVCGSAILSDTWILTAGHCVEKISQKVVWVGGESTQNSIKVPFSNVILHEGYTVKQGAPINDLALLKLSTPLKFSSKIRKINLPYSESSSSRLVLAARGRDETGQTSSKLKKMELVRLSPAQCIAQIPKQRLDSMGSDTVKYLEKVNVCAKREVDMPGVCNGDSGSPLVSGDTLVGIVSYIGYQECNKARLGFYVNVHYYLPWIKKHTGL